MIELICKKLEEHLGGEFWIFLSENRSNSKSFNQIINAFNQLPPAIIHEGKSNIYFQTISNGERKIGILIAKVYPDNGFFYLRKILPAQISDIINNFENYRKLHEANISKEKESLRPNTIKEFLINGPIKIDILKHEITINDKAIFFSPKQYNLLKYLLMNKGKVLMHREILGEIWGKGYLNENQYLRVQIGNIREKIRAVLGEKEIIHTEPSIGYRMENL